MSRRKYILIIVVLCLAGIAVLYGFGILRLRLNNDKETPLRVYESLPEDISTEDALVHIGEAFIVDDNFSSNLPIVILSFEGEMADYKLFKDSQEIVYDVEPYVNGYIKIIASSSVDKMNYVTDTPVYTSNLQAKKRGHTSYTYAKPQYLMKMYFPDGTENKADILGLGEGDSWILNGSMADKSMLRNYLPYRIAGEIGGDCFAPSSKYCEVLLETESGLEYQGVYLFAEAVSRGENRVDIDKSKSGETYTSYIVRRDRFTNFDVMLDTYGRLNGLSEEWIGVKYPAEANLTQINKAYIEYDFSQIERVVYSENEHVFQEYDRYIDIDSFVDYFLVNEFFGNYDAGNHSTYMYKSSGDKLHIGPVWDFDQAMNNYFDGEMDPYTLAFQTKPLFDRLTKDRYFIDRLKSRYSELRKGALSNQHVVEVIEETTKYLTSAREREWYRWAALYLDDSFSNPNNYYLSDYVVDDETISRFNDKYEQELYIIRNYLYKHGNAIQTELTKLYDLAECDTSLKSENELFLIVVIVLILLPSLLINRKG